MKPWNWPLVGFFALMCAMIAIGVFIPPADRVCSMTLLDQSAKQANTVVFGCLEFWLNRYQALVAGFLAVLAGGASVHFLRRQIGLTEEQEQERYRRRHAAARAILPLSLSAICDYAEASVAQIKLALVAYGSEEAIEETVDILQITPPDQAVMQIREFIETLPLEDSVSVAVLIAKIQIHVSRVKSSFASLANPDQSTLFVPRSNLENYIVDAAEIYARASLLFKYARHETEVISAEPFLEHIFSALSGIGIWAGDDHRIDDAAKRRFKSEKESLAAD